MLLIFPPVAKACEPPAGIARLAGTMIANGIQCKLWDANLEGQLWMISQPASSEDNWSRRAIKNRTANLDAIRNLSTYSSVGRYRSVVTELNRLLAISSGETAAVGLADYQDHHLSPLKSQDLLSAAANPQNSPFYRFFSSRLPALVDGVTTVAFSLNYLSQALCTFAMIGYVRQQFPRLKIVLGGGLVTSWMRNSRWQDRFGQFVDLLVDGPGEGSLLALYGKGPADGQFEYAYDLLPLDRYFSPGLILPYSSASGCWWNRCAFCPEKAEGNSYHPVQPEVAHAQLTALVARYRPAMVHLLDSAISPSMLQLLALRPIGAPWYGFARFGKQLSDPDFCRKLRDSGCVMLKLGLESGDQGVLDRLDKGIDLELASSVLGCLKEAGIAVYCYLLFGTPDETEAEARRTLEFVSSHSRSIGFLNLALFNMPIDSRYGESCKTAPFYEGDLSLYTAFTHPSGWDRHKVRRFIEQEFKKEPAVAAVLARDPLYFTSNHAPFSAA